MPMEAVKVKHRDVTYHSSYVLHISTRYTANLHRNENVAILMTFSLLTTSGAVSKKNFFKIATIEPTRNNAGIKN